VIACDDPNIRKIFEITLLDRVFGIFDTPEAGADHLRQAADGVIRSARSAESRRT
jgi:hypothetical protein